MHTQIAFDGCEQNDEAYQANFQCECKQNVNLWAKFFRHERNRWINTINTGILHCTMKSSTKSSNSLFGTLFWFVRFGF